MQFDKKLLVKFDRFCAWSLIVLMVVFFVSGYGMTRGLISPDFSKTLHDYILPIPGALAFAFHSAYGMHVSLKRWKIWGPVPKAALILYGLVFVAAVIFLTVARVTPKGNEMPKTIDLG